MLHVLLGSCLAIQEKLQNSYDEVTPLWHIIECPSFCPYFHEFQVPSLAYAPMIAPKNVYVTRRIEDVCVCVCVWAHNSLKAPPFCNDGATNRKSLLVYLYYLDNNSSTHSN
jgi:hypothetical protein